MQVTTNHPQHVLDRGFSEANDARIPRAGADGITRWLVVAAMMTLAWFALCWRYLVKPKVDPIQPVDAIHVLDPVPPKLEAARAALAEAGAKTMVITLPERLRGQSPGYCASQSYEVICRTPDPPTTRGESIMLAQLARERNWQQVAVVTFTSHISRTRMLMKRCVPAEVVVWGVPDRVSFRRWTRRFVYETGAWLKAQVVRGC